MSASTNARTIQLTPEQVRVAAKSVSRSIDAALKKLESPTFKGRQRDAMRAEYELLDAVDEEFKAVLADIHLGGET